jgi:N-hydroxyarylamine O-acetyltransferase
MNLPAYLQRIGYSGSLEPTLAVLHEIVACQAASIPFENVDVQLGKGIDLAPAAIEDKLVTRGRGGYCFEPALAEISLIHSAACVPSATGAQR